MSDAVSDVAVGEDGAVLAEGAGERGSVSVPVDSCAPGEADQPGEADDPLLLGAPGGGCGRLAEALAADPGVLYGAYRGDAAIPTGPTGPTGPATPSGADPGADVATGPRAALDQHAEACVPCREALADHAYMEALLGGTFRWLEGEARPQRTAVMARIGGRAPGDADLDDDDAVSARLRAARLVAARGRGSRRHLSILITIQAVAALLLVSGFAAYRSLYRVHRDQLARGARMEVKNLAVALRARAADRGGDLPPGGREALALAVAAEDASGGPAGSGGSGGEAGTLALALGDRLRDGVLHDGYGRPFEYARDGARSGRIYSRGRNGRDEGGAGDDVVALVRLE